MIDSSERFPASPINAPSTNTPLVNDASASNSAHLEPAHTQPADIEHESIPLQPSPSEPQPSYVKLAMRNMVRKGRKSLFHFALTVMGLLSLMVSLAYLTR